MKVFTTISLLLFLTSLCFSQNKVPQVPKEIKSYLDTAYIGWKLSVVTDQMTADFFSSTKFTPSFAWGDFDQDGSRDYVVQISYTDSLQKRTVLVFLKRVQHFVPFVLETNSDDPEIFINVTKKGSQGYNWEKEKPFKYSSDAVDVVYAGKSGMSYFYRNGHFTKVQTGD